MPITLQISQYIQTVPANAWSLTLTPSVRTAEQNTACQNLSLNYLIFESVVSVSCRSAVAEFGRKKLYVQSFGFFVFEFCNSRRIYCRNTGTTKPFQIYNRCCYVLVKKKPKLRFCIAHGSRQKKQFNKINAQQALCPHISAQDPTLK